MYFRCRSFILKWIVNQLHMLAHIIRQFWPEICHSNRNTEPQYSQLFESTFRIIKYLQLVPYWLHHKIDIQHKPIHLNWKSIFYKKYETILWNIILNVSSFLLFYLLCALTQMEKQLTKNKLHYLIFEIFELLYGLFSWTTTAKCYLLKLRCSVIKCCIMCTEFKFQYSRMIMSFCFIYYRYAIPLKWILCCAHIYRAYHVKYKESVCEYSKTTSIEINIPIYIGLLALFNWGFQFKC